MKVEIRNDLPEELHRRAVEIYYEAFAQKFAPLFSQEQALAVFPPLLQPEQGLFAFVDGRLAGLAGLQHGRRQLFRDEPGPFLRAFGLLPGLVRWLGLRLFQRTFRAGELLMDGLCVEAGLRGRGVGTCLLQAVCEFARQHGYRSVRLDVVDTNPRARRLYERLGFRAVRTRHYPLTMRLMGFGASTTLTKSLE